MKFGIKSIETICETIKGALTIYMDAIDQAYLKNDDALTVNLPVKIQSDNKGGIEFDVKISFTPEKVEDHFKGACQEDQLEMFEK